LPGDVDADLDVNFEFDIPTGGERSKVRARGRMAGVVADFDATANVELDGSKLDFIAVAPHAEPAKLRRFIALGAIENPLYVVARGTGTLPQLDIEVQAAMDAATLLAKSRLDLERRSLHVELSGRRLNPAAFERSAPQGRVDVDIRAGLSWGDVGLEGQYHVSAPSAELASEALPPVTLDGRVLVDPGGAWLVKGTARLSEPGAPTSVEYRVRAEEGSPSVWFSSSTSLDNPARLQRSSSSRLTIQGEVEAEGRVDLEPLRLHAELTGHIDRASSKGWLARNVDVGLKVTGSVANPRLEVDARWDHLDLQGRRFQRGRLDASGTRQLLQVRAEAKKTDRIVIEAKLALQDGVRVLDPEVTLAPKGRQAIRLRGESMSFGEQGMAVRDLRIEGPIRPPGRKVEWSW
jgi:autotransporter translocation and assembly factor TamB